MNYGEHVVILEEGSWNRDSYCDVAMFLEMLLCLRAKSYSKTNSSFLDDSRFFLHKLLVFVQCQLFMQILSTSSWLQLTSTDASSMASSMLEIIVDAHGSSTIS